MTEQELKAIDEAWRHLQDLPRRYAQETFNTEFDWNIKARDCDHKLPDGRSTVSNDYCNICRRYIEPPS